MATKTKKPTTTTKKPAAKKTAVVKAHRGMAHVPRGRRRPIGTPQLPRNPRRRPTIGRPRRPGGPLLGPDDRPIRAPGIDRPQMPRGRNPQIMTPAMRRRLMEMRRRAQQRRQLPPLQGRQPTATDVAQLKAARDRFNKMQEANKRMQANVFGRRRKPTQATQTPKVATPRKRPTGTPRGPQVTPRRRNFRFRGRRT